MRRVWRTSLQIDGQALFVLRPRPSLMRTLPSSCARSDLVLLAGERPPTKILTPTHPLRRPGSRLSYSDLEMRTGTQISRDWPVIALSIFG
jgi:hypothetical protein